MSTSLSSASASQPSAAPEAADRALGKGPWDVVVIGSGIGGLVIGKLRRRWYEETLDAMEPQP